MPTKMEVRQSLFTAISANNLEHVKEIVDAYGLSYCRGWSGGYAVLRSATRGGDREEIAKFLIENGAKVNLKKSTLSTPLHYAAQNGSVELVRMLISKQASVDVVNVSEETPLFNAVRRGSAEIVEALLKAGANSCSTDKLGFEPLHSAVDNSLVDIAKLLLDFRASEKSSSEPLDLALVSAVNKGSEEMVAALLAAGANSNAAIGSDRDWRKPYCFLMWGSANRSPLPLACQEGHAKVAKLLIEHGAALNFVSQEANYNLLHLAVKRGHSEIVEYLLSLGFDPNAKANDKSTRLLVAAEKSRKNNPTASHLTVDSGLLSFYEDLYIDTARATALHLAADLGYAEVVKVLVEAGADIDAQEKGGEQTALHLAFKEGNDDAVKVLLENGCSVTVQNKKGNTVLDYAFQLVRPEVHQWPPHYFFPRVNISTDVILRMHAVKLKVLGFEISEKVEKRMSKYPELLLFEAECKEELEKIKNEKLCCHLTLYDILMDLKNPVYVKNKTVRQTLGSLTFDDYPIYGSLLKNSVEKNKRKIDSFTAGMESFRIILKTSGVLNEKKAPILLDEVAEKILSYLRAHDLRILISAGEAIKHQVCKK